MNKLSKIGILVVILLSMLGISFVVIKETSTNKRIETIILCSVVIIIVMASSSIIIKTSKSDKPSPDDDKPKPSPDDDKPKPSPDDDKPPDDLANLPHFNNFYFASGKKHNTTEYKFEKPSLDNSRGMDDLGPWTLVIRRGFDFKFYSSDRDMSKVTVDFRQRKFHEQGDDPKTVKYKKDFENHVKIKSQTSKYITFTWNKEVTDIPLHTFSILFNSGKDDYTRFDLYVIFNPWHPDDDVYMDPSKKENGKPLVDEYVLHTKAVVFSPIASVWSLDQFDQDVFLTIFNLLTITGSKMHIADWYQNIGEKDNPDLSNVVQISRYLTYLLGIEILSGNWDDNFANWNFEDGPEDQGVGVEVLKKLEEL